MNGNKTEEGIGCNCHERLCDGKRGINRFQLFFLLQGIGQRHGEIFRELTTATATAATATVTLKHSS